MNAIQKISNAEVEKSALEKYILSINLRIDGLSFLIMNHEKKAIHMESFEWLNATDWNKSLDNISLLFEDHDLLKLSFSKCLIFIASTDSMLIPNNLYKEDKAKSLFNQYLGLENQSIFSDEIDHLESKINLVFGLDSKIRKAINSHYNNVEWHHFSQFLIVRSLKTIEHNNEVVLRFENGYFEAVAINNNKLEAHNYFTFNSSEEFIFNLLSFVKQIGFDVNKLHIKLKGKISKSSSLQLLIEKYVVNVSFEQDNTSNEAAFSDLIQATNANS